MAAGRELIMPESILTDQGGKVPWPKCGAGKVTCIMGTLHHFVHEKSLKLTKTMLFKYFPGLLSPNFRGRFDWREHGLFRVIMSLVQLPPEI
jgi:hypothetical protein